MSQTYSHVKFVTKENNTESALTTYLSVALIVYLCRVPILSPSCTKVLGLLRPVHILHNARCLARSVNEAYFRFIRRTVRMPGYDCSFLSGMDPQRCVCPLCQLPMRDPVIISSCGHRFCDVCLQEYFRYIYERVREMKSAVNFIDDSMSRCFFFRLFFILKYSS